MQATLGLQSGGRGGSYDYDAPEAYQERGWAYMCVKSGCLLGAHASAYRCICFISGDVYFSVARHNVLQHLDTMHSQQHVCQPWRHAVHVVDTSRSLMVWGTCTSLGLDTLAFLQC